MTESDRKERRAPKTDLSRLRVLVVDDEPNVVLTVREMLRDMGVTRSYGAKDGQEALDFLRSHDDAVDVIITDWNMPRMSGVELLKDARSAHPDAAVLLVTGRADQDSVIQARELGVKAYLRKPFSAMELRSKLVLLSKQLQLAKIAGAVSR